MTSHAAALAAAGAVLAGSLCWSGTRQWTAGTRTRRRLRGPASPRPLPMPARLRAAFGRAGLGEQADQLLALWLGALVLALALSVVLAGGRILLAIGVVAGPAALLLASGRETRRRTAQLPDALDAVAAGLRGGLALPAAISGAAAIGPPLGDELASVARDVDAGRQLTDAVGRWQARAADAHTALAAAALTVAAGVGGPGARAVDGAAASLRERLGVEAETAALATQGRASAAVLTLAPIGFAFLLTSLDPAAGRFLLGTPIGWLCIALGLALDGAGAWWMARLVRRAR